MKKLLLLTAFLVTYSNIFAFLTQRNWRWRNDDGTEVTATWKANENTFMTLTSISEIFRLRVEVYNNNPITDAPIVLGDSLQYATSTSGPWTNVDTLPGANPFMISKTSAFVIQDEPTTAQLTGVALTFVAGLIMVDSAVVNQISLPPQRRSEYEWTIKGTANTSPNTTYYFRHWGSTANPLDIGVLYPSLLTAAVLPIKLTGFTVSREDKQVKLEWITASEQNNDRFEIQRSNDGRSWKTIADIKGHGTTTVSNTYKVYDQSPLSGINYYVIRQYDVDGHSYQSDIRSLRIIVNPKSIISVYPNPSHSGISFSIANKEATNVEAILTNANGNIVHREIIKSVPANATNKLNMDRQPAAGVYILKLKAQGLSESARVVIE